MDDLTMLPHPSLQPTTTAVATSTRAVELSTAILTGTMSLQEGVDAAAAHLLAESRADVVVFTLTNFVPSDPAPWTRLGERVWLREWVAPGADVSTVPAKSAGPEAALTMPWLSPLARRDIVAVTDSHMLPPEAAQDRRELDDLGLRSLVGSAFRTDGVMFGSISVARVAAGVWPDVVVADLRLLKAAIASRLMLEHSRRSLAEAIDAGAEAQLAYQHFFGSVGHELRTPLSAILGYTEVLLDDAGQSPEAPLAAALLRDGPVIVRACEQVLTVVDSLLGAGRVLASDDQRHEVDVADAVADVVHWHRVPAQAARVEMVVEVDPCTTVWAHPSGVRQVLANLVGNAVTHHREGGGHLHVSTERLRGESGAEMVRIIVRDDGPGLAADQVEQAFEPFARFAAPGTTGSGLGLSMARTIAERDGGAVRGESTPGVGSSFWLELPVRGA